MPRRSTGSVFWAPVVAVILALTLTAGARAQSTEFTLRPDGTWTEARTPAPGSDEAAVADARRLLAESRPRAAYDLINRWIVANDEDNTGTSPWLPEAYLVRADARVLMGNEFKALYDYELIARRFPQSPAFVRAIQRELDIALMYSQGLKRKRFGLRILNASEEAAELMVRVQERMPGSVIAERAAIELADHYFARRDMRMASEAYDIYLMNFPQGPNRVLAMQRRIYANIARYRGPSYDASGLLDAREQIRRFAAEMPVEGERLGINNALLARVDESLASQRLEVAQWHLRRGEAPSARFMLRRVLRDHPRSAAASRALQIMSERGWLEAPETQEPAP